jgi:predicted acetyltransferase/N-acetylglutamate synthase-like GNAT family acetyltransferase
MKVNLVIATDSDREIIQNLGRFATYEMSRYCGFLPGWEVPTNGLYECFDLNRYWQDANRHSFLIKVEHEIAGFALINKIGSTPDVDWNMEEFFVIAKFQGKGIGRDAAQQIFNQFQGIWEVMQMPENKGAIDFWNKVVSTYTNGNFQKTQKIVPLPKPHPMIVLRFSTPCEYVSKEPYSICYQEHVSLEDETVLLEGIMQEALEAKGMGRIQSFAFFIRDSKKKILGGVKGATYYGCLYVDSLWVAPEHRKKDWGSKLIQECEKLGKERECTFVSLTTMDWEALPFYQKLGYQTEYVREGYEKDSKMFVLRKTL